jgi:hypothetical protein
MAARRHEGCAPQVFNAPSLRRHALGEESIVRVSSTSSAAKKREGCIKVVLTS